MPPDAPDRERRFPSYHELDLPEGLSGWEEMYPEQYLFDRTEREREYEDGLFWLQDPNIGREPILPWDVTIQEALDISYPQNMSRVLPLPDTVSMDIRFVAGYKYISILPCEDQDLIEERTEVFEERLDYQIENFERLYEEEWKPDVRGIVEEIRELPVPEELPRYAPDEVVTESRGHTETVDVIESYDRLVELLHRGWQRHFEFMNPAYIAYVEFYEFCKEAFPGIPDTSVARMTSALDVDLYRPDEELADLARLAHELGPPVTEILADEGSPEEKMDRLRKSEAGREFLEAFEDAKDPWFYMSYGNGFRSNPGAWIDDLEAPFDHLRTKLDRLEDGEEIGRDVEGLAEEREALFAEYRSYLTDEEERERFEELYERCRDVYWYLDDHNFWIDHYLDTAAFRKLREFGDLLVAHDLLDDPEDVFYFTHYEVVEMLTELCRTWALGPGGFVSERWKERAAERAEIYEAAEEWDAPPALGTPPAEIDDTLLESHMGITTEKVEGWLDDLHGTGPAEEEDGVITGFGASEGSVEGVCRVVTDADGLDEIEQGEILVCPATNPSWSPAFSKISAAVTDSGGITHHAATVCREYGLPAVVGTEEATERLRTGDRIRVDGSSGRVEIVERAG